ncbi:MAG TPA: hypothetical protein VJ306_03810 [Pyrinomonadaceae bacterium]|jgi:hypothetical protein|nr:hypothetical protein [Pyrinomonadaceae bacterium]
MNKLVLVSILVLTLATGVFAQGRGRGGGAGGGRGSGGSGGPPPGVGVDRGIGNASSRSGGRSDDGLGNASTRSNGRSDDGLERARQASSNLRHADDDLRDHPNLPRALHTNANDLRAGYQTALATNPNLTFGNYVAATRLGQNLNRRFPNITRDAILNGLASDRSLGQTLQDLGLTSDEAKEAKKQAEREIKEARKKD